MYSFEQLMTPVWEGDMIIDESLTMVEKNGISEAPLLFVPDEILSVTSADKTIEYYQEKDWTVNKNLFCLTKESSIFRFQEDDVLFDEEKPGKCFATKDGRYSLFSEGHFFHDRQICITYKCANKDFNFKPNFCGDVLVNTINKLRNKNNLRIVLYGDSISAGANSSGLMLTTPFLPNWGNLLAENLRRNYKVNIDLINTSVGGMDSKWGVDNVKELVINYDPDLVIIAFGMNDRIEKDIFVENIGKIRESIKTECPQTEFILCATTVPNKLLKGFYAYQSDYKNALEELKEIGTAIADFWGLQDALLRKKRFIDLTGNNVNHPNDFMIRCHAQVLSEMLIESSWGTGE